MLKKQKKYNKLVAVGCSLTKDNYQKTWPDYLSDLLNLPLDNIGARGAGLDFLSKRLLSYNLQKDDLIGIMLPSADRFDWYVEDNSFLQEHALTIAAWQNGKFPSLLDLDGNNHQTHGFVFSGGNHRGYKKYWYKYFYSQYKAELDYWANVILIQNFLETKNIDYFITSAYDKDFFIENKMNVGKINSQNKIIDHVNFNRFIYYNNKGFVSFSKDNNYSFIKHYPGTEAHKHYAEYLYQNLKKTS